MKRAVLISIKPQYCELIASGKKTIEVRKSKPKLETPFKCYIYCTKKFYKKGDGYFQGEYCGKVIGEFVCDTYIIDRAFGHDELFNAAACLDVASAASYMTNDKMYGWHISDLKIYDTPKELSEFSKPPMNCHRGIQKDDCVGCWDCQVTRPPQSWCYTEQIEERTD